GEIQHRLAGRGVNREPRIRRQSRNASFCGLARAGHILKFQVYVVKEINDVALRGGWNIRLGSARRGDRGGRRSNALFFPSELGSRLLYAELGNLLRLAVINNLKIFFMKIPDRMPLMIADHYLSHHEFYVDVERGGTFLRDDFRCFLFSVRGSRG